VEKFGAAFGILANSVLAGKETEMICVLRAHN
jgi:hypothetical protein